MPHLVALQSHIERTYPDFQARHMPLPNGVDPFGAIHTACPSAGWLGNRGILHDEQGVLRRRWASKAWLACAMHYKGLNRKPLMRPGRYSELFFLDEATSLAAGHRPCSECRRDDFKRFKSAWLRGNGYFKPDEFVPISVVDRVVHSERVAAMRTGKHQDVEYAGLPDGAFFLVADQPHLKWNGHAHRWSDRGYVNSLAPAPNSVVAVLTPPSIVAALTGGYSASVHPSAQ